ncbi:MAG: hypothetical protein AB7O49_19345 [Sphingomonadales bacterium]
MKKSSVGTGLITALSILSGSPQAVSMTMNDMLEFTKDNPAARSAYFAGALDMIYNEVHNGSMDFSDCTLARFRDGQLLKLIETRLSDPKDGGLWGSMPAALVIRSATWTLCDPKYNGEPTDPSNK